jgi:hypothetical protein
MNIKRKDRQIKFLQILKHLCIKGHYQEDNLPMEENGYKWYPEYITNSYNTTTKKQTTEF